MFSLASISALCSPCLASMASADARSLAASSLVIIEDQSLIQELGIQEYIKVLLEYSRLCSTCTGNLLEYSRLCSACSRNLLEYPKMCSAFTEILLEHMHMYKAMQAKM